MNKAIKFFLTLAVSCTTAISLAACNFDSLSKIFGSNESESVETSVESETGSSEGESVETPVESETTESSENESVETPEDSETSDSSDELPVGPETDNEVGPKATVATVDAELLASFNAEGVTLYDLNNFSALDANVTLETAYVFAVTQTVEEAKASEYANWIADYYVSVDTDLEAGKIGLAGSYESWDNGAWVAFYAPIAVEANQQIGLLESTGKKPWTYAEIVEFVGTFRCGAFDLDNACAGITLKVELRLTNPDDATDVISVCVTEYTFA